MTNKETLLNKIEDYASAKATGRVSLIEFTSRTLVQFIDSLGVDVQQTDAGKEAVEQ